MSTRKICTQCGAEYGPEQKFCPNDGSALRLESTDDALIGQVIADRYHVTSLIGEGGMGRVYVAEHVRMGRKSALKVMSPALATTADAITRFNREASNASRINHPNVAAIYDFGETPGGLLYIAMEFVEGETLHALIQRGGPLPIARAAQITKGAADALAAAHHLGIIHRDLKPDNIMLARQLDGSDWVKVVDFGIAKSVAAPGEGRGGQTVTTAGVSLGTPEYMSPEQLAGEKLDHHTDIYSLGLVLFNMLTGDLPYPKLTSKETLVRRLTSPPATLAEVRPDIEWPPAVQAVLTRALDPEPTRRFDSVVELGRAIVGAAAAAPADLDRTVRVSSISAAAPLAAPLAPTSAQRPAGAPARPSAPAATRKLEPEPKSHASKALLAAAAVLVLAVGGYAAVQSMNRAGRAKPAPVPPTPTDTVHDTVRVAVDSAPAGHSATVADSAHPPVSRQTVAPAAPTPAPATEPLIRTQHPWLTANGDSAAVVDTSHRETLQQAMNEIRGHLQLAGRFIARGDPAQGSFEMREAQTEIKTIRDSLPGERMPKALDRTLLELRGLPVRACYTAAGPDLGGQQRCRDFQQRQRAALARSRGGAPRLP